MNKTTDKHRGRVRQPVGDVLPGAGRADAGHNLERAGQAEGGGRAGVRGGAEEDLLQELLHEDAGEERPVQRWFQSFIWFENI